MTVKSKANPNYLFLKESVPKNRFTLLQGGTRSGKTYAVIYWIIWFCRKYSGVSIDICRYEYAALKATVWKDFIDILVHHELYDINCHHKTDKIYILFGNTINYYGADDPKKIHGRKRDIIWLNEGHQFEEETVDQVFPRTSYRVIVDYNPSMPTKHWLDKYIKQYPPCITTYRDNTHLTKEQIAFIESKRDNPYWWAVYGNGERARPKGVIFSDWELGEFDESLPFIFGMDFGFVDPTTLMKVAVKDNKIYVQEMFYEKGLSPSSIVEHVGNNASRSDLIIGDHGEKLTIEELREKGFNIVDCTKGPDSVRLGLISMMDYKIIVHPGSDNLIDELNNYRWHDKKSNTPIDDHNHCIDAVRYAFHDLTHHKKIFFLG